MGQSSSRSSAAESGYKPVAVEDDLDLPSTEPLRRQREVRVIEPVKKLLRIETRNTLASVFLGKDSRAEAALFRFIVNDIAAGTITLWAFWWLGLTLGLLVLLDVIDKAFVWTSLLMLPLPFCVTMVLSIDLAKMVLLEFETYLLLVFDLYLWIAAIRIIKDVRCVFWCCFLPSMIVASFVDAYPSRYRALFSKQFFIGFGIVLIAWTAGLYFDWCTPVHDPTWRAGSFHGYVASSTASSSATLFMFCLRHCYIAFVKPQEFVVICSSVRTDFKRIEEELRLVDGQMLLTGKYRYVEEPGGTSSSSNWIQGQETQLPTFASRQAMDVMDTVQAYGMQGLPLLDERVLQE